MNYLFVGDGRLSRHLQFYFSQLGLRYKVWTRQSRLPLQDLIQWSNVVLLAIRDDQIADFVGQNRLLQANKTIVHFSGAQYVEGVLGVHPLMTFGPELYSADFYKTIPFVVDAEPELVRKTFPALKNSLHFIEPRRKALYHAYCVMAGNFPQILWNEVFNQLKDTTGLPPETMRPYIQKCLENFLKHGEPSLTGPLMRGDQKTQVRNIDALQGSALQDLYFAFVNFFKQTRSKVMTTGERRKDSPYDNVTF